MPNPKLWKLSPDDKENRLMTLAEWYDMKIPITWLEYVDDTKEDLDADEIVLDLSAPPDLPDGVYDVENKGHKVSGVEIKNGFFVPEPTAKAIYEVALKSDLEFYAAVGLEVGDEMENMYLANDGVHLHHCFVDMFAWQGDHFSVRMGS